METTKQRESYLDIAKGIGIILVILGHISTNFITRWFYSFDLPLFFVVTGICFHYKPRFLDYLKSKAKRCLIPYFTFGIAIVLVESKTGFLYERGLKPNFTRFLFQQRYSTLWFLATLFFASIFFYFIVKICKENPIAVLVVSVVLSIIFVALDQSVLQALPWNIDTAFCVLGFIGFGYFFKNYKGILDGIIHSTGKKKLTLGIVFFVLNFASFIANMVLSGRTLDMYWNSYGYYPLILAGAVFGCLLVLIISSSIKFAPLEKLGKNSMTYFALHQSVFMWPLTLLFRSLHMITYKPSMLNHVSNVLIFILIMICCFIVDKVLRSTKLKFILGE